MGCRVSVGEIVEIQHRMEKAHSGGRANSSKPKL